MKVGLFGFDEGPRSVMKNLSQRKEMELINDLEFSKNEFDTIVVGTSGSKKGIESESIICQRASEFSLNLVIIEDYPGNYRQHKKYLPDLLIVEHQYCKDLYLKSFASECPRIIVVPNPRYDEPRALSSKIVRQLRSKWSHDDLCKSVIWAGQPETDIAKITLSAVFPLLKQLNIRLLFKAHPKDEGYERNAYKDIANSFGELWTDITNHNLLECICKYTPSVLLTQYSSVAIEVGFYGIPSVNILLSDAGGKLIKLDKGYTIPPWCISNAAVVIENISDLDGLLTPLLFNNNLRQTIISNFMMWFGDQPTTSQVANVILGMNINNL